MKKILTVVLLLIGICFSGCARAIQLSEKLLVQGLGVDYKNDEYVITLQTINSNETSNDKSSTPKKMKTIISHGATIKEASHNIIKQTGKEPLYSQTLILILGKGVIKNGLNKLTDFFIRHHEFSSDTRVLITEQEASKILNVKDGEEIVSAENILAMLEEGPNKSKKLHSTVESIISDLKDEHSFVKIALIDTETTPGKETLNVERIGIFTNDKYTTSLSKEETLGALFIRDKAKNAVCTIDTEKFSKVTYTVSKSKTKISFEDMSEHPTVKINIKMEADINETENVANQKNYPELEKEISKHTEKICKQAIKKALTENGCDVFEFSKMLEKINCNKRGKDDNIAALADANYNVECNTTLLYI